MKCEIVLLFLGLGLLPSLQSVHLSSNGIRQIGLGDFQNCSQLKDIDLQNNEITKIHPDAFRDLHKLQVVDLRENALTTPLPQVLMSLNFFQLEVDLSSNAWIFNCRLNAFKHLLRFLFDSTRKKWRISYNKSANNSEKPLLYLSSSHLNCSDSVLLKRAVIPMGKTSVLTCDPDTARGNGVSWWTPKGRISKDNNLPHVALDNMNNLVIYNAEKTAEGLYLCILNTTKKKYLMYNLEVKESVSTFLLRRARDTNSVFRKERTEQDLALAVSLSVLITFVCAFCLGAFARPYLVSLWRRMRRNKNSSSEHTYSNQAFSDGTLSREHSASHPTNTQTRLFICDENSSRNTYVSPTETSLYESVTDSGVYAPNTEEYQKQSDEINVKKSPVFSDNKASTSNDENVNVDDNGLFSARIDYKNIYEVTPRKLMSNDISLQEDAKYANNEDLEKSRFPPITRRLNSDSYSNHTNSSDLGLSFTGDTSCAFPITPTQAVAQEPSSSKVSTSSALLQSEVSAGIFGDSSSDEGTPFTMSDCSSLADFELEEPGVSDNLPACQSLLDGADMNSGTAKFSTLPESPNIDAELWHTGKTEDKNNAYFETTINNRSDTVMPEAASPHADTRSDHASMPDSDTISSSSQEVPDTFEHFTNPESTVQNSISDSLHKQNIDFSKMLLSLKNFPTSDTDTENSPEAAELQPYRFPTEPQHSLRFSPTEQQENAPEGSPDEHRGGISSEKNHGEAAITLRRNTSTSEEDDDFIFAPTDTGLNEIVKKTSLLRSSNESPLQSLPEHTTEEHFMVITTEKENLLPQGTQVNTTKACADKMQRGLNEKDCNGCTELQDTSDCPPRKETQACNAMADFLHLHSSGKPQSVFNTEDCFQLAQSDKNAYSFSVPQDFFNDSTQYGPCSFPQKTAGDPISKSTDSSEAEDDATLTGQENNSTTAVNLQNSREKLSQKSQTHLGQGQFFVKKKRAFDGFANILQSRTNFNS
nr:leucine-rich repeat-containing protein 66 [Columba livia]